MKALKVIISGGGTGGHIFPAISIADKFKELNPDNKILFVGAEGKMEMEKVPAAGYEIKALPIVGIQRKLSLKNIIKNISLIFKIFKSLRKAKNIIRDFQPDIVIGVGGFASAPILWEASSANIPCLIQEQNGFAGLANRILGKRVNKICVAYESMQKFFPADKIVLTGNPIRKEFVNGLSDKVKTEAIEYYKLSPEKKHIFVVGGSLGSRTLNEAVKRWILENSNKTSDIELIWQCGKHYKSEIDEWLEKVAENTNIEHIRHFDFIQRMDFCYAASDLIISRSGASTVSELAAIHKAVIFVPSPNVAEDHQTHNAMALVSEGAAEIVKDEQAYSELMTKAVFLLNDEEKLSTMRRNIAKFAKVNASLDIVKEAYKLLDNERL